MGFVKNKGCVLNSKSRYPAFPKTAANIKTPMIQKIFCSIAITRGAFKLLLAFPTIIRAPVNAPPNIFTQRKANAKKTKK
jgi:hypothetical protein